MRNAPYSCAIQEARHLESAAQRTMEELQVGRGVHCSVIFFLMLCGEMFELLAMFGSHLPLAPPRFARHLAVPGP